MHNDEEQPHIHFYVYSDTEVNAKALHYGHAAKKNFIAASKAFQDDYHAQVAIHCGMARLGPKKQRLTRRVEGTKEARYESRSSGGAVLDSAATKEKEAHKRLQAVQEHAELLAKRSARPARRCRRR